MRRLLLQSSAQSMIFNARNGETFVIEMRGTVHSLIVKNVTPGILYVVIIKQDLNGGHRLNWSGQMVNATSVLDAPSAVTVQCFIGQPGGGLKANAPGTWKV